MQFGITFDYLCPFARNAAEAVLNGVAEGRDWQPRYRGFSLAQVHTGDGEPADLIFFLAGAREPDRDETPMKTPGSSRGRSKKKLVAALGARTVVAWLAGVVMVYGILFGTGKLLLGDPTTGAWLLAAAAVAAVPVVRELRR